MQSLESRRELAGAGAKYLTGKLEILESSDTTSTTSTLHQTHQGQFFAEISGGGLINCQSVYRLFNFLSNPFQALSRVQQQQY